MARKTPTTRALTGGLGDVRRTNNFRLFINDVMDGNDLDLIVQQAFLPKVSLQPIELRHGNDAKKLAGVATWTGGNVTILDVLSKKELDAVLHWHRLTYDANGGIIGFAETFTDYNGTVHEGYKKSGSIHEYTADGKLERKWELNGLWISDLDLGELDATRGDLKQITMTISIDPSPLNPIYPGVTD